MTAEVFPIEKFGCLPAAEENELWASLGTALSSDDGFAARSHLAAGRAIVYCDPQLPGAIMRKWPDGHREIIDVDAIGVVTILRSL